MRTIVYCLFISLAFFSQLGHAQSSFQKGPIITKTIAIKDKDFDSLDIKGPVNVYINATQTHTSLQILGDPARVLAVTYSEKNHILYLGTKPIYHPVTGERLTILINTYPAQIKQIQFNSNATLFGRGLMGSLSLRAQGSGQINLCTNKLNLKSLYSNGNKSIIFHNILSSNLKIETHNSHNVIIQGIVSLSKINSTGNGNLSVYWINTPYLTINASGDEKIKLTGIAKTLDAKLSKNVRLLTSQLIAQRGFIKTENQAQATVNIKNTLHAIAKDKSVIYYSTPVNFINSHSENGGLILDKTN